MLNCVFWRHIPLEIEFKSRGSDSNAQRYRPLAVAQLVTPKKKTEQDAYSGVNSACRENRQELDIRLSIYSGRGKHA